MSRYLLHCIISILLSIAFNSVNVFADDDDSSGDQIGADSQINTANDMTAQHSNIEENSVIKQEETKGHVRSIVDGLLRINKHIEPTIKDPKIKKLMKEQNIGKQIDKLRSDITSLEKTLNNHYLKLSKSKKSAKNNDETDEEDKDNSSLKKSKPSKKGYPKRKHKKSMNNQHKTKRASGLYTVKDVSIAGYTNKYLNRIDFKAKTLYKAKRYTKKKNFQGDNKSVKYEIKSYGKKVDDKIKEDMIDKNTQKPTIKSGKYFSDKLSCKDSCGC